MKNTRKWVFLALGLFALVLWGMILHQTRLKVTVVDTAQSPDGAHEVVFLARGEALFDVDAARGCLVLKENGTVITRESVKIYNEGIPLRGENWLVTWQDDHAEIVLSGYAPVPIQWDELVTLYFDGRVERATLTTHFGVDMASPKPAEEKPEPSPQPEPEPFLSPEQQRAEAGYQAIYELLSDGSADPFAVFYGASASSTRCILSETETTVDYLIYNGISENGQCGLYVHYRSPKANDGTWSASEGAIVDLYAYVYRTGEVISSGKTHWEDSPSDAYREATEQ